MNLNLTAGAPGVGKLFRRPEGGKYASGKYVLGFRLGTY
jgi:hypothetical protein